MSTNGWLVNTAVYSSAKSAWFVSPNFYILYFINTLSNLKQRKAGVTDDERGQGITTLDGARQRAQDDHRVCCPYRGNDPETPIRTWGNLAPLRGGDPAVPPERSAAELVELFKRMQDAGDETLTLENLYNPLKPILYPYPGNLNQAQRQECARLLRHVFCPRCRKRIRRKGKEEDKEVNLYPFTPLFFK